MAQSPMISVPLKATSEIDWIEPLKSYIRHTYGDDPERYAEECATLNRLRQDMRGAGKESTSGRDMLYRYYGQLEMLDLRFPVDEQHIKVSFTWFDAFTQKPTTQYSLAFEKASVIFNISAHLSSHGASQNRADESALKAAYHSFQASAGMFTYINENFLHAPSSDLSRETVKTLIQITLAQAQEIFLEKQVAAGKKAGLLAKLAAQTGHLYGQSIEGIQDNVNRTIFEKVWLTMVQIKTHLFNSVAQYYQALVDDEAGEHGSAVSRLQVAESLSKEAERMSRSFPTLIPPSANLSAETSVLLQEFTKRQHSTVQEKLREAAKDNDFVYHQTVAPEASLPAIAKMPAAKPIPVSELYAGRDISRITGPDLFSKIVPLAVTESASLYEEEKAKLVRAESEKVDAANSELAASLDYLSLPGALQILKGGVDQEDGAPDGEFRQWCADVADHENPQVILDSLEAQKDAIVSVLDKCSKQLEMEESVCEKMRSKYGNEWSQQPSGMLTTTLRGDVTNYREALQEALRSDGQLVEKLRHNEVEFDEMRRAARDGEVDQLYHRAVTMASGQASNVASQDSAVPSLLDADFDENRPSVADQINKVEDILKKLKQVKRERNQVLKDLKDRVHADDISQVLILNKKSISNYEAQVFEQELEKFGPHRNRLLQASHKQSVLMKELTTNFNALLKDKRVQAERSKHESTERRRSLASGRYKRAYQEFLDLESGLQSAKGWYLEMRETVDSLDKNVETFVSNRRSEGAQLLDRIEQGQLANKSSQAERERERLRGLMERMSANSPTQLSTQPAPTLNAQYPTGMTPGYIQTNFHGHYQVPGLPSPTQVPNQEPQRGHAVYTSPPATVGTFSHPPYSPSQYGPAAGTTSPPPNQPMVGQSAAALHHAYQGNGASQPQQVQAFHAPSGFASPSFGGPQQTMSHGRQEHAGQPHPASVQQPQKPHDPWAGLNAWS
ncbi:hypothetical protein RJ55_07955 [Drechmeria coniospora]|nr:hypothetical protein RJ55_07955 [Drechmeria coniospora]